MPVIAIQNLDKTKVVFSVPGDRNAAVEWASAGDPDGGDIQRVPAELLESQGVMRAIGLGLLKPLEGEGADEALLNSIERQAAAYRNTRKQEKDAVAPYVQPSPTSVMVINEDSLNEHIESIAKARGPVVDATHDEGGSQ